MVVPTVNVRKCVLFFNQVYVRHHSGNDFVKISSNVDTGDLVLDTESAAKMLQSIANVSLVVGHPDDTVCARKPCPRQS